MRCRNYDECVDTIKGELLRPTDSSSLYSNKIYDNQVARQRCATLHPVNFTERIFSMISNVVH